MISYLPLRWAWLVLLAVSFGVPRCADAEPKAPTADGVTQRTSKAKPPWRDLADYPRPPAPDTGWGIHDHTNGWWKPADQDKFFKGMKTRWGFSWWKMLTLGANKLDMTAAARRQGVEPVIRIYDLKEYPKPGKEMAEYRKLIRDYVKAGARYFELANEPNIDGDWSAGGTVKDNRIGGMCKTWLRLKPIVMKEGGIPIFYAMTPGSAGQYYADCFETFKKWDKIEEAFAGAAIGIHPYPLNHPLDYPFDDRKNMPHATGEERFQSLMKDNTCFLILELVQRLQDKYLPYPIPILATESGLSYGDQADRGYPKITMDMHRDLNMEIFNRMNPRHPKYWGDTFFSNMVWAYGGQGTFMFSGWFNNPEFGDLPVLGDMEKAKKFDRGIAYKAIDRKASSRPRRD
ncbi:MAG TPA: hypothetical protein VMY37_25825 [Thermoguttaceae bacterium]|nr:hypothetical protein [Thermoguttaceae bacterium]